MHLFVSELYSYQKARCNNKKILKRKVCVLISELFEKNLAENDMQGRFEIIISCCGRQEGERLGKIIFSVEPQLLCHGYLTNTIAKLRGPIPFLEK